MAGAGRERRLEPARRREQIVAIAAEHFSRDGVAGASVAAIARDAGVTRALVYHYFAGKEALLEAVLRAEAEALLEILIDDPDLSPRDNAIRALDLYLEHYVASSGAVRDFYASRPDPTSVTTRLATEAQARQVDRLVATVGGGESRTARVALGAWLAFVERAAQLMVEDPSLPRSVVVQVCVGALDGALGQPLSDVARAPAQATSSATPA